MRVQKSTVVGVFEDRQQADRAIDELGRAGFRYDQIGVAMRYEEGEFHVEDSRTRPMSQSLRGGRLGALAGLRFRSLAGLGVLSGVIPIVGPAIAAGTLGIILSNAAAGAGIGGLVGVLGGAGIPEDEAHYYQGEFEAGRTIVTVQADAGPTKPGPSWRQYHAYDMSTRPDMADRE